MTGTFVSTKNPHEIVSGDQRIISGSFACAGGSTGGVISTGLHYCYNIILQYTGSNAVAEAPTVKSSLILLGGVQRLPSDVEIVCTADTSGIWVACGV